MNAAVHEERLRELTARLRAQAAALPASEAIGAGTAPEAREPADRPAEAKPAREEPAPACGGERLEVHHEFMAGGDPQGGITDAV